MDTGTLQLFFAILALVALTGAVAVAVLRVLAARGVPGAVRLRSQLAPVAIPLAFAVALTATLGSLYFSEVANFTPCRLCWYQRIAMYPLTVLLAVAWWRRDVHVRSYVWPLATIGAAVAAYHWFIERFPSLESGACDLTQPCSVMWFEEFGFVTLAFMAWSGFAFIGALLTLPTPQED